MRQANLGREGSRALPNSFLWPPVSSRASCLCPASKWHQPEDPNGFKPEKKRYQRRVEAFNSTTASMHTKHFYMGHYLGPGLG